MGTHIIKLNHELSLILIINELLGGKKVPHSQINYRETAVKLFTSQSL